jgi:hypothetical protein
MSYESEFQNLLSAVTDALLAEERTDLDAVVRQYAVPRAEVDRFIDIILRLHLTLVGAAPSRRFVHRLKYDLLGTSDRNVVSRIRYLPPRVQIAAGIALIAGFMLFTRRRLMEDVNREKKEIPALQQ